MTFERGFRNPTAGGRYEPPLRSADLADFGQTNIALGFGSSTFAGQPGLRMHITDLVMYFTVMIQAAAADISVVSFVPDIRDDIDLDSLFGAFDLPLVAENGAMAYQSLAVPIVRLPGGVVLPVGAGLRVGMTISLRNGTVPQIMRGHITVSWFNRFIN